MSVDSYPYKPNNYKQTPIHVTDTNLIAELIVYNLLPNKPAMKNIETTFSQRIEASRYLLLLFTWRGAGGEAVLYINHQQRRY